MASSSQQQQQSPAVQAVLTALDALYNKPEKEAKDQANSWLQDFQKTVGGLTRALTFVRTNTDLGRAILSFRGRLQPEAWETANTLLLAQDLPIPPRLFASQTFRTKVRVCRVALQILGVDGLLTCGKIIFPPLSS